LGQRVTDRLLQAALAHWGFADAQPRLIAQRENAVYRVETPDGPVALRLHRPGLRSEAELWSELQWMKMLARNRLMVPAPITASDGSLLLTMNGTMIDVLTWLDGTPMGRDGALSDLPDPAAGFAALGQIMARMHDLADDWTLPPGFRRPAWDGAGLVGDAPLWGRFWENPELSAAQALLLIRARDYARGAFDRVYAKVDYGLIHADLVPENVLLHGDGLRVIDFDDGGFGYRLFDLATAANRAERADPTGSLRDALVKSYRTHRPVDPAALALFQALRSFTYVGWIVPRMDEAGAGPRCARFIADACLRASALLDS
jgi:Ser/Thr protein kinase RdoA (MazF antagonist)